MRGNRGDMVSCMLEKLESIKRSGKGSDKELRKLSRSFTIIHTAIFDVEAKYRTTNEGVYLDDFWKLQDLAYDIEEFLDRWIADALTSQNEVFESEETAGTGTGALNSQTDEQDDNSSGDRITRFHDQVNNFFVTCLRFTGLRNFLFGGEIRKFRDRLGQISSPILPIEFRPNWRSTHTEKAHSSPVTDEAGETFGREADKKGVIDLLLSNEALPVISIVASAGLGKTTLAQLICSDERVVSHFDKKIWVNVSSRDFLDMEKRNLLIQFSSTHESSRCDNGFNPLRDLQKHVTGHRQVLVVLDDVSIDDIVEWVRFRYYLESATWANRILVTTRSQRVAREMGTSKFHYLQPLQDDASWFLFSSVVGSLNMKFLRSVVLEDPVVLEDLVRMAAKIICGVPLFAKTWASNVAREDSLKYLLDISAGLRVGEIKWESNMWKDVLWILESVYDWLPSHLKPCLMYCSLFPKGSWIVKEVLIQLWIAEGFVPLEDEMGENLDELGGEYFDDLLSQTYFYKDIERDDDGNIVRCKMHETFHDFICHVSRRNHTCVEIINSQGITKSTRHSSYVYAEDTKSIPKAQFNDAGSTRTLLCFGNPKKLRLPHNLFSYLKVLRVLDLSSTNIREFSHSSGTLKHLRYLNLSYTRIKMLPKSICGLCFLQTLKLSHSLLRALPRETRNLISLRHLEIDGTCMSYLPHGISRLTRLQNLSEFIVGDEIRCRIGELGNLNFLQGRLIISNLNRLVSRNEAEEAKLDEKYLVDCLIFDGKKHFISKCLDCKRFFGRCKVEHLYEAIGLSNETEVNEIEMTRVQDVLEGLQPHVNLTRLEIWNYIGPTFPKWMEEALLTNLVFVKLVKCKKVKQLPPLGNLPSLKSLHMHGLVEVEHICSEFYGYGHVKGFPKLEQLVFEGMVSWKVWDLSVEQGNMPCVVELKIIDCPSLKTLPCLPNTLRKLEIYNCEVLPHNHSFPTIEHLVLKGKDGMLGSSPNLPKLKSLKITLSSVLTLLPVCLGHLTTLKILTIHFCPKLRLLPEELQHLTMLQELHIVGCPLLKKQCQEGEDEWLKISHIPYIEIDNKKIQGSDPSKYIP